MFTSLIGWYSIASCMIGFSKGLSYDNDEVALVVNNIETENHPTHSCQRTMTWFQIVELLSVIVFGGIIRLLFKSKGPNPCDSLFLCLLHRATTHGNKQEQQHQPPKEHILKQKQQHILPMEPYNSRFDNGYVSD